MGSTVLIGASRRRLTVKLSVNTRLGCPVRVGVVNRRMLTLLVAFVPLVAFGVLLGGVTVPYVSLGPGPTFNTLGEVDGKEVVDIEGTKVFPTSGHLNMTTVAQRDDLTLGQAIALWLSGREQLVPRDLVYPPDKSRDEIDKTNTADFVESEALAQYAALGYLKYAKAVTVETVKEDGAADGKLEPGDAIDKVDGTAVPDLKAFEDLLKKTKPGQQVVVDYRRKNAPPGSATITLGSMEGRDNGVLGVAVRDVPWAPFTIDFNLANIGGPSAGLMFSLAVVDKLTTGDLNDAKFVAGTGTIGADGKVGPIGGITHKMLAAQEAGASVFLVPADNCAEADSAQLPGLQLIKVDTLASAVDALHTFADGGEPPRC